MVRTQIQLEEAQYEQIRRMAHRERISMSEAVRRLLRRGMAQGEPERPRGAAALLGLAGIGDSGRVRDLVGSVESGVSDLGTRHREHLHARLRPRDRLASDLAGDTASEEQTGVMSQLRERADRYNTRR